MGFTARLKLADTLNKLLESKQLSEITVSMLTRESGLARRIFYDNFLDIYDFELWVHEYLSREVINDFWNELPFDQVLLNQLITMQKYHRYYKQLLSEDGANSFRNTFISVNLERSYQYLHPADSDDLLFIVKTYTIGAAHQIYYWIEKNMPVSPDELCRLLILSMPEKLRLACSHE